MRQLLLGLSVSGLILFGSAATAAPTCQNRDGDTTRCGTTYAMPVGWSLPPAQRPDRDQADPPVSRMWLPIFMVCGLLGLISAMPDFDGWDSGDDAD